MLKDFSWRKLSKLANFKCVQHSANSKLCGRNSWFVLEMSGKKETKQSKKILAKHA